MYIDAVCKLCFQCKKAAKTCVTTVKQGQVKSHNLRWQVGSRFWPSRRHGSETWKAIAIAGHVSSAFLSGKHVSLLYKRAMKPIRSIHLCRWMAGEKKTDKENNFYPVYLFYNFFLFIYQENMKKKYFYHGKKPLHNYLKKKQKKWEKVIMMLSKISFFFYPNTLLEMMRIFFLFLSHNFFLFFHNPSRLFKNDFFFQFVKWNFP